MRERNPVATTRTPICEEGTVEIEARRIGESPLETDTYDLIYGGRCHPYMPEDLGETEKEGA